MRRFIVLCAVLALLSTACSPPKALQKMAGREPDRASQVDEDAFPAPEAPRPPAQLLFGTVILTNESSWGLFLKRGQETGGALVLDVLPDSPASKLGMQPGDVISWIDGETVTNHEQLLVAFRDSSNTTHEMKVHKADGSTVDVEAQLVPPNGFSLLDYLETKIQTSNDPITRYLLAEQSNDDTQAFNLIRSVIAENPTFAEGHALLARRLLDKVQRDTQNSASGVLVPTPELDELTEAIDKAVELDPQAASIYRARSQIFLFLNDGISAEADATTALEMDDQSAEGHYLLGTSEMAQSHFADAIERLHLAVQLNPFEPKYYVALAVCYRELGRESDTKATIAAAKTLVTDPAARQQLDDIANGNI